MVVGLLFLGAPAAQASFGVQSFTAGVLVKDTTPGQPACDFTDASANPPTPQSRALYATVAGSHPYCAFTSFTVNQTATGAPIGTVKDVRVDLPPGLVPNPQATAHECSVITACPKDSQVGAESTIVYALGIKTCFADTCPAGTVKLGNAIPIYNMAPTGGELADFALDVIGNRVDILGGVRDVPSNGQPGDYGEYFTISNLPDKLLGVIPLQTVSSTLVFFGDPSAQDGGASGTPFLTNPSTCIGPQPTELTLDSYEAPGQFQTAGFTTPVGATNCSTLTFPTAAGLAPSLTVTPTDASNSPLTSVPHDAPTGLAVDLQVPQDNTFANPDGSAHQGTPQVQNVSVTLPQGFTINPGAAGGLQTCSDAALAQGTTDPACPNVAPVGTVSITSPALAAPLTGNVYLGAPQPNNLYRLFLDVEGDGLTIRLVGSISADTNTGQLTATFAGDPQVPFSGLALQFNGGPGAVIASPLACGKAGASATLTPWSADAPDWAPGPAPPATVTGSVTVDADGNGGACPSPPPFTPSVSTALSTLAAGASTALTLSASRGDGQQYLSQVNAQLPPGLLGLLASVPLCPEPPATARAPARHGARSARRR